VPQLCRYPIPGEESRSFRRIWTIGLSKDLSVIETLQCLKKYGQRLDLEIAREIGMPLATVRKQLVGLAAKREVVMCDLIRYEDGKRIDAWQCRVSGYVPPAAPGRKATSKT
jgi:hypothetical protein